ncbi:MAG: HepT-like ribonuclease domain-containing protein [Methanobacterium sp.]
MNRDQIYLKHILDEIEFLEEYFPENADKELLFDPAVQRFTVRSLEIIGEAVKNLSDEFKDNYPQIEWKEIAGMRDRLVHRYFNVDLDIVYEVIMNRLPELKETVLNALE